MQWSHYSQAIFDRYTSTGDNIIVQACPGAGKTTNIKHLWGLDEHSTVYLVFNKHNQIEAEQKLPAKDGSAVLTLNGLGHRAILANYGAVQLDDKKVLNIVRKAITPHWWRLSKKERYGREWQLYRAVSMAKMYALSTDFAKADFDAMCSLYDLEQYGDNGDMWHDACEVLDISDNMKTVIDYADQIRFPALHNMSMPRYHNVLCDEVQDFSPIQAMMVAKLHGQRYVFVGDKRQSIYGFRGAMNDSMEYLKDTFNCVEMPLSITYRCAKDIVREAAAIFPGDIEAWDESPQGEILYDLPQTAVRGQDEKHIVELTPQDQYSGDVLVLCRMNRPLVDLAFHLLKEGIACHVRGRDIGQGLITLIKKQDAASVRQLATSLAEWHAVEMEKARIKDDEVKMQKVTDRYDSVMLFIDKVNLNDSPAVVIAQIEHLFEQGRGICLSTVHKAKGLEAEKAYLLSSELYDLCYHRCKQQWQREQELNIKYVAVTRAKQQLVYM